MVDTYCHVCRQPIPRHTNYYGGNHYAVCKLCILRLANETHQNLFSIIGVINIKNHELKFPQIPKTIPLTNYGCPNSSEE